MVVRGRHGLARRTALIATGVLAAVLLEPATTPAVAATPVATGPLDAAQFDSHLTRAPYLTDLVGRHVAISFATDRSAATASVSYGKVGSSGCTLSTTVSATRVSITVGTVLEYQWTKAIDLPAAGTWCYRVTLGGSDDLLGGNPSPAFTTQAQPGDSAPFSFDVIGDWGQVDANGRNADQANLMQQIARSGARFLVTVGDNGYPNGNQINFGDLQQTGKDTSAIFGPSFWTVPGPTIPIFTAPGNHGLSGPDHTDITTWPQDRVVDDSGGRYQDDVYCCVNGTTSAHYASEWYAFTAGNARFYVLDAAWNNSNVGTGTMYSDDYAAHWMPGDPEYEWLAKDLAAHPGQLKFAFFHYPLYVDNATETSDPYLQGADSLEGLLGRNGVKLVFNGHAHVYERNKRSAAGMPVSYVTGGGGGTPEPVSRCTSIDAYSIGWSPTNLVGSACGAATAPSSPAQVIHFLKVTVADGSVTVTPTDSRGRTFDVHSYDYTPPVDTWLDSGPQALTNDSSATFTFHGSSSSATFSCRLDGGASHACTSPTSYSALGDGSHTFTVAATVGGTTDSTPASQDWTVDTTPPTTPTGLTARASTTQVELGWSPSSDASGVGEYDVYRDGALVTTTAATGWTDSQVTPGTSYSYQVSAVDRLGNASPQSAPVVADVPSLPPPPPPPPPPGLRLGGVSVALPSGSRQVVTVNHTRGYRAEVILWRKSRGHWHRVASTGAGHTGYGGLVPADRIRQGTGSTPLGTFRLLSSLGRHTRHRDWRLPYHRIRSGDYWVGDNSSAAYNRLRNKTQGGFRWWLPADDVNASQRLTRTRRVHEFMVLTSFNRRQVRYRGAGIFLQVNGRGRTTGSVSAPRWFLRRALGALDPALRPVIAVGR